MARLLTSGAETGGTDECQSISGSFTAQTTIKRSGAYAFKANGPASVAYGVFPQESGNTNGTYFVRCWCYIATGDGYPSSTVSLIVAQQAAGGALWHCRLATNGILSLRRADFTLVGTESAAVPLDAWFCVDFQWTSDGTNVTLTGRLDGTQFGTGTYANASVAAWTRIGIGGGTGIIYCDDIAINSNAGTDQNSWPGIGGKVVHLLVDGLESSNGAAPADWDSGPTLSLAPATMVDEAPPPNDATDYIDLIVASSGITNLFLDFTMTSAASAGIGASDTITLVATGIRFRAETAAAGSVTSRMRGQAGGTVVEGTAITHALTTWDTHDDAAAGRRSPLVRYTNPQGNVAWTVAALDTAVAGVRAPDATPDMWVTSIWLQVEYLEAAGGGVGRQRLVSGGLVGGRLI